MISLIKNYIGLIKNFIGLIKNYIMVGLIITIALLSYFNKSLRDDNADLISEVGVERIARLAAQESLRYATKDAERYYKEYALLQKSNSEFSIQVEIGNKKLENYKRREHIVIKKPKIVERLANIATVRLFNDYSCTTGNSEACTDNKD